MDLLRARLRGWAPADRTGWGGKAGNGRKGDRGDVRREALRVFCRRSNGAAAERDCKDHHARVASGLRSPPMCLGPAEIAPGDGRSGLRPMAASTVLDKMSASPSWGSRGRGDRGRQAGTASSSGGNSRAPFSIEQVIPSW